MKTSPVSNATSALPRESNMELLRLALMFLIVVTHYSNNSGIDFPSLRIADLSVRVLFFQTLQQIPSFANYSFFAISGYFLVAKEHPFNPRKAVNLISLMLFYTVSIYLARRIFTPDFLSDKNAVGTVLFSFLPFLFGPGFLVHYLVIYLFAPFLNKALKLEKRKLATILALGSVLFLLLPQISQILGFSLSYKSTSLEAYGLMYCFGGFLRTCNPFANVWKYRQFHAVAAVFMALTCGQSLIKDTISVWTGNDAILQIAPRGFTILSVPCAMYVLEVFRKMHFRSRFVNWIAASVLAVYLLHENPLTRNFLFMRWWPNSDHWNWPYLHCFAKSAVIMAGCLLVDALRRTVVFCVRSQWNLCGGTRAKSHDAVVIAEMSGSDATERQSDFPQRRP